MEQRYIDALKFISADDYQDWITVGMALKHEGALLSDWEEWSKTSPKYRDGDCAAKWNSFNETAGGRIVTGGTLIAMAKRGGWTYKDTAFDWDDEVDSPGRDYKIVDASYVGEECIPPPRHDYDPAADLREYLSILFKPDEHVCYCDHLTKLEPKDGDQNKKVRWVPRQSVKSRTAGQLIEALRKGIDDASICGESEGGALIRFNPIDGQGEGNANILRRHYCLIESDTESLEKQYSLYKALNLPIAVLVHSGNKSLHAIVRVDAESPHEYRERVNFYYDFCKKNGLHVDQNDKNESRYSRMPGIIRNGHLQYIIDTNMGPSSYAEWKEWADEQNDNLPDSVSLADVFHNPPPLAPELIPGILRERHKMLISGPSKAGKSFSLIELAVAIAEGGQWLGYKCNQGAVLYVNLELDSASCFQRFLDVYKAMGKEAFHTKDIYIWNLRGRAVPMDKLTPFMIRRFKSYNLKAIIIDPIYKVITGDENDATEMSQFCSYFDRVSLECNSAIIYCHHHSKAAGVKYSRSADRSSGSGVFARDPDAILDLTELRVTPSMAERYAAQNPRCSATLTAWELSLTLREFQPTEPKRIWFDYPLHVVDRWNFLADATGGATIARGVGKGKTQRDAEDWARDIDEAYEACGGEDGAMVPVKEMVAYLQRDGKPAERTVLNKIQSMNNYTRATVNGIIYIKAKQSD